jgi:hypothetical protein
MRMLKQMPFANSSDRSYQSILLMPLTWVIRLIAILAMDAFAWYSPADGATARYELIPHHTACEPSLLLPNILAKIENSTDGVPITMDHNVSLWTLLKLHLGLQSDHKFTRCMQ